jgi:predicted molibdopterin-dependent oxidoreductase YjgC
VPGLGTSFGRGGATTAQQDLANADCILIEGSSMAEAHPVGFRWVMKAKERGATINHTTAICHLGGATLDNEENYLIKKLLAGGLGMVCISNQARI